MNQRNLLPAARIDADRRRRAVRWWVRTNATYGVALSVAAVAYLVSTWGDAPAPAGPPVADVSRLNVTLAALRQQSATLETRLRSTEEFTNRPDWGTLLALLAHALGDEVVLDGVDAAPASANAPEASPQKFRLSGIARSQSALSVCVLRIEALHLFARVQFTQAVPTSPNGVDGVKFQLACTLPEEK